MMKVTGLILITFILLKCGNRVIGKRYEPHDEDIKNDSQVATEVYHEPTTENKTDPSESPLTSIGTEASTNEETSTKPEDASDSLKKEAEGVINQIISSLKALINSLQNKNTTIIQKPPVYGAPWVIDTPTSKYTKRNAPNFLENVLITDCSSNLCSHKGLFRLNQSCTKYYECLFSQKCQKLVPKMRTCPKCLKFNAQKNICDLPENVPECSNLSAMSQKVCTGSGLFAAPYDCQKYYECEKVNDTIDLTVKMCPPSMVFSKKNEKCVEGVECRQNEPECGPGEILSDKFNCSVFYRCNSENQAVPLVCPSGFVFNGRVCEIWDDSKLNWLRKQRYVKKAHSLTYFDLF